jgi:DNA-binding response OmpR family regulator
MSEATLLVVDDDADLAQALATKLVHEGWGVTVAASGDEARRAFASHRPDLVLLDLGLPDMDGLALCRQLKTAAPETLILVLTGRSAEEQEIAGLETGADDYVVKPVSLALVATRVRALLRRRPATGAPPVAPAGPLEVGMISAPGRSAPLWLPAEAAEAAPGEEEAPRTGELHFSAPGEFWRINERWHLVRAPQVPANATQMRRLSMGLVEAGYLVELIAEANWMGSIKEVYLYNARTLEEIKEPIARGYLLVDLYRRAEKVQGID